MGSWNLRIRLRHIQIEQAHRSPGAHPIDPISSLTARGGRLQSVRFQQHALPSRHLHDTATVNAGPSPLPSAKSSRHYWVGRTLPLCYRSFGSFRRPSPSPSPPPTTRIKCPVRTQSLLSEHAEEDPILSSFKNWHFLSRPIS